MLKRLKTSTPTEYRVIKVAVPLAAGIALLFLTATLGCHLVWGSETANLPGFEQLIDVDSEGNLPTWFAAFLLHIIAIVAWVIGDSDSDNRINWRIVAFVLFLMGIDEIASIHNTPSRRLGEWIGNTDGILMNAWVIPGAILCLVVAVSQLRFLFRQPRWLAIGLVIAAGLYITGALLLEMLSTYFEFQSAGHDYDGDEFYSLKFECTAVAEEAFEYSGVILTMWLFLKRAKQVGANLIVRA